MQCSQGDQAGVVTTDFFSLKNPPKKGIRNPRKFAETAFGLEKMAISEIQDFGDGYYLLQVIDRKESTIPDFEAVAEKVKTDLIAKLQREQAKADAEKCLARIADEGLSLKDAAAAYDLKEMETGYFKRAGSIPKIGYEPQIVQSAFKLTTGQPLAEQVVQGKQGFYVIRLKERKAPEENGFEKDKAALKDRLVGQKKQIAMQQWLEDLKQQSQIDINRKLIE